MDDLSIPRVQHLGCDRGRGNLLGIEPYVVQHDYVSQEAFVARLNGYLQVARNENLLNDRTVVIFPEQIGTWLVLAGESGKILDVPRLSEARRVMVLQHPLRYLASFLSSREKGRLEAAFFRMKAGKMADVYAASFGQVARTYAVTIAAGSVILPAPQIENGRLRVGAGPLRNAGLVFRPDGTLHPPVVYKSFPTAGELPYIEPGPAACTPSFETPAGRLGVLICADSWFPEAYAPLKEQGIDLLAVPSYDVAGMQRWNQPWHGYSGWPAPGDVQADDIHRISEAQAWSRYSLAGRLQASGAAAGMNVFLRGQLWDQDLGGWPAALVREGEVFVEEQTRQAAILSLWL